MSRFKTNRSLIWWLIALSISSLFGVSILYYIFYVVPIENGLIQRHSILVNQKCTSDQKHDLAALFQLRTKLGVNYDAGHWFHIAENFMVQHSTLREKNQLANSSTIYFSFDTGKTFLFFYHPVVL